MKSLNVYTICPAWWLFLVFSSGCSDSPQAASSSIEANEIVIEFGPVPFGWDAVAKIRIENDTDEDVFFFEASSSCGCLTSKFSPGVVSPGDGKECEVVIETVTKDREFSEAVRWFTSNNRVSRRVFRLTGEVLPQLNESPITLELGRVFEGVGANLFLELPLDYGVADNLGISLEEIIVSERPDTSPVGIIEAKEITLQNSDEVQLIRIELQVASGAQAGLHSGTLRVEAPIGASGRQSIRFEVPYSGAVVPLLAVEDGFEFVDGELLSRAVIKSLAPGAIVKSVRAAAEWPGKAELKSFENGNIELELQRESLTELSSPAVEFELEISGKLVLARIGGAGS